MRAVTDMIITEIQQIVSGLKTQSSTPADTYKISEVKGAPEIG